MLKTEQEKTCSDLSPEQLAESVLEDDTAQLAADVFKALGDPTRLKIITLLLDHEVCVHTISDVLNVSQSAISHQLRVMRQLRLVRFRKEGRHVYYRLDDEHIHDLIKGTLDHINHQ